MSPHHHGARLPPPPPPHREHHPSFSAALLDAIYHSLDGDGDGDRDGERTPTDPRRAPVSPAKRSPRPPGRLRPSTTLSPSVSSVRSPRLQKPPRPCRVRPDPQPSLLLPPSPPPPLPPGFSAEKKRNKRKKPKSASFTCLLDALLCNRKSAKSAESTTTTPRAVPAVTAEPASARSILSSRASRRESAAGAGGFLTPGRRAVRFSPEVTIVVDEEHGCEKGSARLHDTGRMEEAAARGAAAEADRRVEELLRVLSVAEEKERAKESSESSSDLFELESLPAFDSELTRTRAAGTPGMARPRPRVLADEMIV